MTLHLRIICIDQNFYMAIFIYTPLYSHLTVTIYEGLWWKNPLYSHAPCVVYMLFYVSVRSKRNQAHPNHFPQNLMWLKLACFVFFYQTKCFCVVLIFCIEINYQTLNYAISKICTTIFKYYLLFFVLCFFLKNFRGEKNLMQPERKSMTRLTNF